jgi:hypothetical protein
VHGGQKRDTFLGDVDTREDGDSFRDTRQPLVENFSRKVAQLEVDVILFRTNTTTFANFNCHGTGNDITRSEIFRGRRLSFHELFTLRVQEIPSFTSRT